MEAQKLPNDFRLLYGFMEAKSHLKTAKERQEVFRRHGVTTFAEFANITTAQRLLIEHELGWRGVIAHFGMYESAAMLAAGHVPMWTADNLPRLLKHIEDEKKPAVNDIWEATRAIARGG